LDNVVTSTIVFEEDGRIQEYVGGYNDWLRQGHELAVTDDPLTVDKQKRQAAVKPKRHNSSKLGYKDQRELDKLPAAIEAIEAQIGDLQAIVAAPDFYAQEQTTVRQKLAELSDAESELEQRVERWGELETKKAALQSR
ncbi:MAG: ABC transporter ATP-binding protein, partial [Woeseiaceae bacterium]